MTDLSDILKTLAYQYCMIAFSSASLLGICIVFLIELYHSYNRIKKHQCGSIGKNAYRLISYYFACPLFIYLCYILNIVFYMMTWFKISTNCTLTYYIETLSWSLSKELLYEFFILRIYIVYKRSCFAYNPKILICLALSIFCCMTMHQILITFAIKSSNIVSIQNSIIYTCTAQLPNYIFIIAVLMDQVITFTAVYLFAKPLIKLLHEQTQIQRIRSETKDNSSSRSRSNTNQTGSIQSEYDIIVKVAALSFISAITTLFMIILQAALFANYVTLVMDFFVNTMCIMLMNNTYNKMYGMICCLTNEFCKKCIMCICCLQNENESQVQMPDIVNRKGNTLSVNETKVTKQTVDIPVTPTTPTTPTIPTPKAFRSIAGIRIDTSTLYTINSVTLTPVSPQ